MQRSMQGSMATSFGLTSIITLLLWGQFALSFEVKEFHGCLGFPSTVDPSKFTHKVLADYGEGHGMHSIELELQEDAKDWSVDIAFTEDICVSAVWSGHGTDIELEKQAPRFYSFHGPPGHYKKGDIIKFKFNAFHYARGEIGASVFFIEFRGNQLRPVMRQNTPHENVADFCKTCEGGFTMDRFNCRKYLRCDRAKPVSMPCGPGTMFNKALNICDHVENAGCGRKSMRRGRCTININCPPDNYTHFVLFGTC